MSWYRVAKGRLAYRGRITREPFIRWAGTPEGTEAIGIAASQLRFVRLGGHYRAKRRIWRALDGAARTEPLRSALQSAADDYTNALAGLSYLPLLPCTQISLQRLVVVPRAAVAARTAAALDTRLGDSAPLADLGEAVRRFFVARVLREMDDAVLAARPSPSRPIHAREAWTCVAVDRELQWMDPIWSGPEWTGHLVMYEFPRQGLARRERRTLEAAIKTIREELSSISRLQRHDLLRAAVGRGSTLRA
jgi:hypothetical protein